MSENKENFIIETFKFSLIAILIVLPFRIFIAQPFLVNGASMSPNFETGNYLIVDQFSYNFIKPTRGEIIVFRYPNNPKTFFIKRIVGLPGETIKIEGQKVFITNKNNSFELSENYIQNIGNNNLEISLENDEYFVMGDNRPASSDSRIWGPLSEEFIVGRAFLRLFPFNKISIFPESLNKF